MHLCDDRFGAAGRIALPLQEAAFSCDPPITNFSCPITLPLCVPWRPLRLCGKSFFKDSAAMIRDHKKNLPNQPPLPHLKLVPRAQHGQFGDLQEMGIIAEHCRADVERAASDQ